MERFTQRDLVKSIERENKYDLRVYIEIKRYRDAEGDLRRES